MDGKSSSRTGKYIKLKKFRTSQRGHSQVFRTKYWVVCFKYTVLLLYEITESKNEKTIHNSKCTNWAQVNETTHHIFQPNT